MLQAHERLEDTKLEAVRENNVDLVKQILEEISSVVHQNEYAAELTMILKEPHFQVQVAIVYIFFHISLYKQLV